MADTATTVTETTTPVVAPENKGNNDEAAQLRKELEQARMRANQLENEKQARDKAEDESRQKELEEKEEYKTLYEKTQSELRERQEREDRESRTKELATASETVLKEYSPEVQDVAKTAGISLTDDSEAGKALLKEKLDSIKAKLPNQPQVGSNNGYTPPAGSEDAKTLVTPDKDGATPMAFAAARGDLEPSLKYIRNLNTVNVMKRQSGYYK